MAIAIPAILVSPPLYMKHAYAYDACSGLCIIPRFRTLEPRGLLLATRDDFSSGRRRDSLEMAVGGGGLVVTITMAGHQVTRSSTTSIIITIIAVIRLN